jgi:hypothetical protein
MICILKNIRLLGNYLARPIRDPKGLNGEMKRNNADAPLEILTVTLI